jgi:glutamyl-Q tRNA(Asp) synthetase
VTEARYRGRFAPTPSGPLHFGSLVAALGSCLDARRQNGAWLLRIEDVDPPRNAPGASDTILRTLEAYGFEWDEPVLYQSQRSKAYQAALESLRRQGRVYPCTCSRKQLAEAAHRGIDGPVYPGTCRNRPAPAQTAALRLHVPEARIAFTDRQQGRVACAIAGECGDFVLQRADGVYAYHLAVVVDDAEQGINHIVRGADLLTSTPRHIVLQTLLDLPTPDYLHLPVVLDEQGNKLSKQTLAAPIDCRSPLPSLLQAAAFLGMYADQQLQNLNEFWEWAVPAWSHRPIEPLRGRRPSVSSNPCKS